MQTTKLSIATALIILLTWPSLGLGQDIQKTETDKADEHAKIANGLGGENDPVKIQAAAAIDGFHVAASKADGEKYFGLLAPDAIFLGTDATERWTVAEFKKFCDPYFKKGQGWTYVPTERHIYLGPNKSVAWFDERLQNDSYGEVRGSGVLQKQNGRWLIKQYNLTFPVPNELSKDLVKRIKQLDK